MNHPASIGRYFADAPRPNVGHMSECRSSSHQVSTATSTDIVVDITYSKHDLSGLGVLNKVKNDLQEIVHFELSSDAILFL